MVTAKWQLGDKVVALMEITDVKDKVPQSSVLKQIIFDKDWEIDELKSYMDQFDLMIDKDQWMREYKLLEAMEMLGFADYNLEHPRIANVVKVPVKVKEIFQREVEERRAYRREEEAKIKKFAKRQNTKK